MRILVEEDLASRARAILGTQSLRATIDLTLLNVLELDARRQAVAQLRAMVGLELDNEAAMPQAWI